MEGGREQAGRAPGESSSLFHKHLGSAQSAPQRGRARNDLTETPPLSEAFPSRQVAQLPHLALHSPRLSSSQQHLSLRLRQMKSKVLTSAQKALHDLLQASPVLLPLPPLSCSLTPPPSTLDFLSLAKACFFPSLELHA